MTDFERDNDKINCYITASTLTFKRVTGDVLTNSHVI